MNADNSQQDLFPEAPVWYEGLTRHRRLFVEYYCTDISCFLNAAAAFRKTYTRGGKAPAESSVQSNASRLMRDTKIKTAISKLLRANQDKEDHLNEFRMLQMLYTLAFYNPADIVDKYGNLKKDMEEMGDLAKCVAGIKNTRHGREIKLFDRTKAMEMLSQYLDIIRPAESTINIDPHIYLSGKDMESLAAEKAAAATAGADETGNEGMEP